MDNDEFLDAYRCESIRLALEQLRNDAPDEAELRRYLRDPDVSFEVKVAVDIYRAERDPERDIRIHTGAVREVYEEELAKRPGLGNYERSLLHKAVVAQLTGETIEPYGDSGRTINEMISSHPQLRDLDLERLEARLSEVLERRADSD